MSIERVLHDVEHYWHLYEKNCPFSPYTGYLALGTLCVLFFALWRHTTGKYKTAAESLRIALKGNNDQTAHMLTALQVVRGMADQVVTNVRTIGFETTSALTRSHETALRHMSATIESFNGEEE